MKEYLFNLYVVEDSSWIYRLSYRVGIDKLADEIRSIESRGFRLTLSNIFVKTFTSSNDEKVYYAYSVVELPIL